MFLNISKPIRSSIFIYLLLTTFIILYKPRMLRREYQSLFTILVVFIAIISYFTLTILNPW